MENLSTSVAYTFSSQPDGRSKLCLRCTELNLAAIFETGCEKCLLDNFAVFGPSENVNSGNLSMGPVEQILQNSDCALCRLVASGIRSSDLEFSPTSTAVLSLIESYDYPLETVDKRTLNQNCVVNTGSFEISITGPNIESRSVGKIVPFEAGVDESQRSENTFSTFEENFSVMGRLISPKVNVKLIRRWMEHCETHHSKLCGINPKALEPEPEIRLIDVKSHRIVNKGLNTRYVALSYVWGPDTIPILTKSNLDRLSLPEGLTEANLCRTIYDTMELVSEIGERYLWVDSACIIQDEQADKQRQLPIMDKIYSGAFLVVIAASGDNANAGLPGRGNQIRMPVQRVEMVQAKPFINVQPDLVKLLNMSTWNNRGWTFQEALLSRRALIFTKQQIYWRCLSDTWYEDTYTSVGHTQRPLHCNWDNSLFSGDKLSSCGIVRPLVEPCATQIYCERVVEFCRRTFKDESDVLWAFDGILKSMEDQFGGGFIWGMPHNILDAALLWRPNCTLHCHERPAKHKAVMLDATIQPIDFPSWSWLSVNCGVFYTDTCDEDLKSEVEWHEAMYYDGIQSFLQICSKGHAWISSRQGGDTEIPEADPRIYKTAFGLLQFTAQAASLGLRLLPEKMPQVEGGSFMVPASIHLPSGQAIGVTWAHRSTFADQVECTGEFVLLSSNKLDDADLPCCNPNPCFDGSSEIDMNSFVCKHSAELNVMLVEWIKGVAYRVSLTRVKRDSWKDSGAVRKKITLG